MRTKTQKITLSAMLAALIFVATQFVKIPIPGGFGYVNAGDVVILLSAAMPPSWYAFFAAGIGSALADVLASFLIYSPATFVIKGLMTLVMSGLLKVFKTKKSIVLTALGALAAETVMVGGYFLFETVMYGIGVAMAGVAFNSIQAAFGVVLGTALIMVFSKPKMQ